ncbi:RNA polymerase subunit sigma [Stutzerimonas nosocomialis]|uniref:RNA polymerase subunit sigma n=1 Tax=Stutzerimonas nosocomialis TaxID=1056496 RepID=A0A5R9QDF6_9GAMM|nr:sigma-70 family RNA polymerase sigma factor [Stutzerimonas nosocomialis]TLX52809.1 RNA polymerase subunit sigma [Stutzerimonas nosocomialis]TLX52899.1 RNA polymerase subunit sigma [Stutzerimonas nosocomialis]TLX62832.1 RNA polymerase subunit sigma [Stutzerimonas nosocomialis]
MAGDGILRQQQLHRFYSDHHGWLQGWLRRHLGCSHHAADLAQDTFVRILARDQDIASIREPRAYLHTIAKGLLANHWRRRQIELAYLEALALQPEQRAPSPETRALIVETLLEVDAMLARLPDRVRRAFLMSQLQGLTYAAIGEALGVSERMVKKYMAQAMLHCLALQDAS